jgi:hypothetical protein
VGSFLLKHAYTLTMRAWLILVFCSGLIVSLHGCQSVKAEVVTPARDQKTTSNVSLGNRVGTQSRRIPFNSQLLSNSTIANTSPDWQGSGSRCVWTASVDFQQIQIATSIATTMVGGGENTPAFNGTAAKARSVYTASLEIEGQNRGPFIWSTTAKQTPYGLDLQWSNKRDFTIKAGDEIAIRSAILRDAKHPIGENTALRPLHRLSTRYDQQGGNDLVDVAGVEDFLKGTGGSVGANDRETPFVFGFTKSPIRVALVSGDSIGYGGGGYGASSIAMNGATSYLEMALWQKGKNPLIWMNIAEPASSLFDRYLSNALPQLKTSRYKPQAYAVRMKLEQAVDFTDEFCSFGTNEFAYASSGFDRDKYLTAIVEMFASKIRKNIARKRRTFLCLDPLQVQTPMPSLEISESEYMDAQKPYLDAIAGEGGATQLRRDLLKRLTALCVKLGNSYVFDASYGVQGLNSRGQLVWRKSSNGKIFVTANKNQPNGDGTHPNESACEVMAENIREAIGGAFTTRFRLPGLLVGNPDL